MAAPKFTKTVLLLSLLAAFSNTAPVDTGSLESSGNTSNSNDTKNSSKDSGHSNSDDNKDNTTTAGTETEAYRSVKTLSPAATTVGTSETATPAPLESARSTPLQTEFMGTYLPPTSYYAVPPSYIVETTNSEGMTISQYKWWMPQSASGVSADKTSATATASDAAKTHTELTTGVSTIAQIYITRSGTKELTMTDYLTSTARVSKTKQSGMSTSTHSGTSTAEIKSHYSGAANMNVPAVVGVNALVVAAAAYLL